LLGLEFFIYIELAVIEEVQTSFRLLHIVKTCSISDYDTSITFNGPIWDV